MQSIFTYFQLKFPIYTLSNQFLLVLEWKQTSNMFNLPIRTLAILSMFVVASVYSYRLYLRYIKAPKRHQTSHQVQTSSDEDLKLWQPRKNSNASSLYFTESDNEYVHCDYEEISPKNVEYQSLVWSTKKKIKNQRLNQTCT